MPRFPRKTNGPRKGLMPRAARLAIAGELLLAAAVCDFAARLNVARLAGSEIWLAYSRKQSDYLPNAILEQSSAILGVFTFQ